jgi:threonine synthase
VSRTFSTIAVNIKRYREINKLTQAELSQKSGVDYNVLIKIESGVTTNPTIDTVIKLARGLKISIDELIKQVSIAQKLICYKCGKEYSTDNLIWKCICGGLLNINFIPSFPIDKISQRKPTMWRYREALPISNDDDIVSLDESMTPLSQISLNNHTIFIKQDYFFPTGTYKDRGAAVMISKAKELGVKSLIEDSLLDDLSGSASFAISAYCARGNIKCDLYSPENTNTDKLDELRLYGSQIHPLHGSLTNYQELLKSNTNNKYYANHRWNPYFLQGTKTLSYEIWEQMGWKSPDTVIIPVGNGTLLLGVYIGFNDLFRDRAIKKIPKIIGVQSENCSPIYSALKNKLKYKQKTGNNNTITEGIAITNPLRKAEIIENISKSHGDIIIVSDEEIVLALKEMYLKGFSIELTSAATIAGVKKYLKSGIHEEAVVSVLTDNGFKSTNKIAKILKS